MILSETLNDTGRFFGEIGEGAGAVMESMINLNIFQKITVFDFQALCKYRVIVSNDANSFFTVSCLLFES